MRSPWLDGRRARARSTDLGSRHDDPAAPPAPATAAVEVVAVGMVVLAVVVVVLGPSMTLVGLAVAAGAGGWWRRRRAVEQRQRRRAQLPDALERIAGGLRSGSSLLQALADTGATTPPPLGGELVAIALEAGHGEPVADLLDGWAAHHDDRGTRLAATAMTLALGVGAAPARALDGVAVTLRERLQLRGDRRALATQARASAAVLVVAPLAFMTLFGVTDSAASHFLLTTPAGWLCLGSGVGLDLIGALWMARLTDPGDDL
jgi:tight adherence protein B